MKKQLLLGSALLAAISAFPQNAKKQIQPAGKFDMGAVWAQKYAAQSIEPSQNSTVYGPQPINNNVEVAEKGTASSITWGLLCGSMNVYGMLVSQTRPLQYNAALNAVSFIHRKSQSYAPSILANSNSGNIVAEISSNWGSTWDSTCIFADPVYGGRYPQGAIYNPVGNTNIANAYVIGCGPVTGAGTTGGWMGNFYASKQLGTYDNVVSTTPNAAQFLSSSLATYTAGWGSHGFSRYGFSATQDGKVRSLACIMNDQNAFSGMRGVSVVKGTFNAGVFTWTTDSIIPPAVIESSGDNFISTEVQMAWNESGTVGYVLIPGALQSSQGSNRGYQPIVYKTTNSGTSWSLLPVINFGAPSMSVVTDHLAPTDTINKVVVPYMVDYDMTVDANNMLHIGAIFCSSAIQHDDSLNYIAQFTTSINPNDRYKWAHIDGNRPYLYDFVGDGTSAWKVGLVDSMSSEGPSAGSGFPGYVENPWDNTGANGAKVGMDSRIQMGRTPDGKFINVSWVESDSSFIAQSKKWNIQPNIQARAISMNSVATGTTYADMFTVSQNQINITKPISSHGTQNPKIVNRATLHYMSPTSGNATLTALNQGTFSAEYQIPFTVTNSNPYSQLTNNSTYFSAARLNFEFRPKSTVGINENQANSVNGSVVYPNPASGSVGVRIDLQNNEKVQISVLNLVGQVVKTSELNGQTGENNVDVDLSGLNSGVYMVNVKVGNNSSTKKLLVK